MPVVMTDKVEKCIKTGVRERVMEKKKTGFMKTD
jgi:hypothetical protein